MLNETTNVLNITTMFLTRPSQIPSHLEFCQFRFIFEHLGNVFLLHRLNNSNLKNARNNLKSFFLVTDWVKVGTTSSTRTWNRRQTSMLNDVICISQIVMIRNWPRTEVRMGLLNLEWKTSNFNVDDVFIRFNQHLRFIHAEVGSTVQFDVITVAGLKLQNIE